MAGQQDTDSTRVNGGHVPRRGLIAGAAALAISMAVTRDPQAVAAEGGTDGQPLIIGTTNTFTQTTTLQGPSTALGFGLAVYAEGTAILAVVSGAHGAAIEGDAALSGVGVSGTNTGNGIGVVGTSRGYPHNSYQGNIGVMGHGGVYGVYGYSQNVGTLGFSNTDVGLVGHSDQYIGLYAEGPAYAAYLAGDVIITGSLAVTGAKSAAIKHADGTTRAVYCEEAPESWLTDYGRAKLVGGKAEVKIDPDFAALVKTDDYHAFTSAAGDCKGLYVANQSAQGFTVREMQGGTSSLMFDWRIAVKRSDIKGERLAKVTLPKAHKVEKVEVPLPPEIPKKS